MGGTQRVTSADTHVTIFFAGDVMTGRGVDQILAHPASPELRERWVRNAQTYVDLAARTNGPIPSPVPPSYIWGDALEVLERREPRASIVNLETSITTSSDFWPDKGVHYRMHPENIECLRVAKIDACVLANNHVLDFGVAGLLETLDVLRDAEIACAGAGRNLEEASRPVRLPLGPEAAVSVFAMGSESSGIPLPWAAGPSRPGVWLIDDTSLSCAREVAAQIRASKAPGDISVASIHWGSNWGRAIDAARVGFAHQLLDEGVDMVHGHSSHHVRAVEVYRGKLILHGCGDLLTDYEGIAGHEEWRGDLGAMYFATLCSDGTLADLELVPMQVQRMRLRRVAPGDAQWLQAELNAVGRPFGTHFQRGEGGSLVLAPNRKDGLISLPEPP